MISKELLKFLGDLNKNNNREWFNEHKPTFKEHEKVAKTFFQAVEDELKMTDAIEGHKVWRIYRDVRFSKDKTPFKTWFSGGFNREKPALRGGYYLKIEPGSSAVGGGFYGPNSDDLMRIRKEFEMDDSEIRTILNNKKFKTTFGEMMGDGVKTAPRGFDADHKAIDLIKRKQFFFFKEFTDKEVVDPNFSKKVIETFTTIRPFFDYMSSVLTTDLNGESTL
jgi:uncharacterized protein (TIGR02453 family)